MHWVLRARISNNRADLVTARSLKVLIAYFNRSWVTIFLSLAQSRPLAIGTGEALEVIRPSGMYSAISLSKAAGAFSAQSPVTLSCLGVPLSSTQHSLAVSKRLLNHLEGIAVSARL